MLHTFSPSTRCHGYCTTPSSGSTCGMTIQTRNGHSLFRTILSEQDLFPDQNFIDALIQSSRRNATDLRNHVFALLGHPLAKMGDSTIVKADYKRHVDGIYLEVSALLLQHVDPPLPLAVAADMGRRRPRDHRQRPALVDGTMGIGIRNGKSGTIGTMGLRRRHEREG